MRNSMLIELMISGVIIFGCFFRFKKYELAINNRNIKNAAKFRKMAKWLSLTALIPVAFLISRYIGKEEATHIQIKLIVGGLFSLFTSIFVELKSIGNRTLEWWKLLIYAICGAGIVFVILVTLKIYALIDIQVLFETLLDRSAK